MRDFIAWSARQTWFRNISTFKDLVPSVEAYVAGLGMHGSFVPEEVQDKDLVNSWGDMGLDKVVGPIVRARMRSHYE